VIAMGLDPNDVVNEKKQNGFHVLGEEMSEAGSEPPEEPVLLVADYLLQVCGKLIDAKDEEGVTPLMEKAPSSSRDALIYFLLQNGADTHIRNAKGKTADQVATENTYVKNYSSAAFIRKVVNWRSFGEVTKAIRQGDDITALKDIDLDWIFGYINATDEFDSNVLHWAGYYGRVRILKFLLSKYKRTANDSAKDYAGDSMFVVTARRKNLAAFETLLFAPSAVATKPKDRLDEKQLDHCLFLLSIDASVRDRIKADWAKGDIVSSEKEEEKEEEKKKKHEDDVEELKKEAQQVLLNWPPKNEKVEDAYKKWHEANKYGRQKFYWDGYVPSNPALHSLVFAGGNGDAVESLLKTFHEKDEKAAQSKDRKIKMFNSTVGHYRKFDPLFLACVAGNVEVVKFFAKNYAMYFRESVKRSVKQWVKDTGNKELEHILEHI